MNRDDNFSRRKITTTIFSGSLLAFTGCSGEGQGDVGQGNDDSGNETEKSEQTEGTDESTNTKTETQSEIEKKYSTDGNDSKRITKPADELVLTEQDIPNSGWSSSENKETQNNITQFDRTFTKEDNKMISSFVSIYDKTSVAKDKLISFRFDAIAAGDADTKKELGIGVESKYFASEKNPSISYIRIRDANVIGGVIWSSPESVTLDDIGPLAVEMHRKWR